MQCRVEFVLPDWWPTNSGVVNAANVLTERFDGWAEGRSRTRTSVRTTDFKCAQKLPVSLCELTALNDEIVICRHPSHQH